MPPKKRLSNTNDSTTKESLPKDKTKPQKKVKTEKTPTKKRPAAKKPVEKKTPSTKKTKKNADTPTSSGSTPGNDSPGTSSISSPQSVTAVAAAAVCIEDEFKKLTSLEHVLERPDTYVGDTVKRGIELWVYNPVDECMEKKTIDISLGAMKVVDEILVNARDVSVKFPGQLKRIDVNYDKATGIIEVTDDGPGIPVEMHKEWNKYVMEGIFSDFRAGTNFGSKKKICGGKNGYGLKCISNDAPMISWDGKIKCAEELTLEDKLIGDDGTVRHIKHIVRGRGKMYKVTPMQKGDPYKVNDNHTLTLHVPDHKVIFWNAAKNGWGVWWWDHDNSCLRTKTERFGVNTTVKCLECNVDFASNLQRHYSRMHKDVPFPKKERSPPTKDAPDTPEAKAAYERLVDFCKTIPDNNIFDMCIQDYLKLNDTTQSRISGIRGECVQWPKKEVHFDPYLLGLWLGDGDTSSPTYTSDEPEIVTYLYNWVQKTYPDGNIYINRGKRSLTTRHECHYRISSKDRNNVFVDLLKETGIFGNKHIPLDYLVNDRETRLKVLAGLIDSDGNLTRDGTRITIAQGMMHKQLALDIVFLARSLGFFCSIKVQNTSWTYEGEKRTGECYAMRITGQIADIPTLVPRKKCSNEHTHSPRTTGRIIIEEIEDGDYVGFEVDGNQRFVINDFTVTHNCTNAFSTMFYGESRDGSRQLKQSQTWTNNMSSVTPAKITSWKGKTGVTVRFQLDWKRFNMTEMDDDFIRMLDKRVYDLAATTDESVKIYLNGKMVPQKTFDKYISLYIGGVRAGGKRSVKTYQNQVTEAALKAQFKDISDSDIAMMKGIKWDVGVAKSEDGYQHVSFVNGLTCWKGGSHVNYISKQLVTKVGNKLRAILKKKNKENIKIKPEYIRDHIFLFVNSVIVDPRFSSQSKEECTSDPSEFGYECDLDEEFIDDIIKKCELEEAVIRFAEYKSVDLTKTDGKRVANVTGIPNFEDAHNAGKKGKSRECKLVITEGLSAKTLVVSGFSVVGRDDWGVWPLKGKIFNPRDKKAASFADNQQYFQLRQIMGLRDKMKYITEEDLDTLRYGEIIIMTDQDSDGSHIKGLIANIFAECWPELLAVKGFIKYFKTPLVKITKRKQEHLFFNLQDFDLWKSQNSVSGWDVKYLKGLGSNDPKEAKIYFSDREKYITEFYTDDLKKTLQLFEQAFGKAETDTRKEWLGDAYDPTNVLDQTLKRVSYDDFIMKDLVHFFKYNTERNIPNICDGLKTGQRKVLYTCRKRNITKSTKVFQLAGEVAKTSAYHHGDASLNNTIVGMAQDYAGANNINMLVPEGEFGSRTMKGDDASAARYIHTKIGDIVEGLFPKADDNLYQYCKDDDGNDVEPVCYAPVIPMILVNGCAGTGCGFSTSVPPYNPLDIIQNLKQKLDNKPLFEMVPWYRDYNGTIVKDAVTNKYYSRGTYIKLDPTKIKITELPLGFSKDTKSFQDYLDFLESSVINANEKDEKKKKKMFLKSFKNDYTREKCDFTLTFPSPDDLTKLEASGKLEDLLCLRVTISTTNMYLFDEKQKIAKYSNIEEIFDKHYTVRHDMYAKRRAYYLENLQLDILKLKERIRFLDLIMSGALVVFKVPQAELVKKLEALKFKVFSDNDNDDSADTTAKSLNRYDYLSSQSINRFTDEQLDKLKSELAKTEAEYILLDSKTPTALWKDELEILEKTLAATEKQRQDDKEETRKIEKGANNLPKNGAPKAVTKKRKA